MTLVLVLISTAAPIQSGILSLPAIRHRRGKKKKKKKKKSSRLSQRLDLLLTSSSISLFSSISSSCLFTSSSTVFLYLQYESSLIPFFPSPSSRVLLHRHHADVCMPLRGYGCWLCIVYLLSLGLKIPRRNTSALSLFISLTVNGLIRLSKRLPGGWPPT